MNLCIAPIPEPFPTSVLTRVSGYLKGTIAKYAGRGVIVPETAGSQGAGNTSMWMSDAARTLMVIRDLNDVLGITDERIIRAVAEAMKAYDRETCRPRYIIVAARTAYATDEVPAKRVAAVIDQVPYDMRLSLAFMLSEQVANKYHRLEALGKYGRSGPDNPLKQQARILFDEILNRDISTQQTARILGVADVVAEASILDAIARFAEDAEQRNEAAARLAGLVAKERITDDDEWTSGLGDEIAAAFGVK